MENNIIETIKDLEKKNNYIELAIKYLDSMGMAKKLSDEQKRMFITTARDCKLNPFRNEIYAIAYENQKTKEITFAPIVSFLVYWERAMATGLVEYIQSGTEVNKADSIVHGWCELKRKDWSKAFRVDIPITERIKSSPVWNSMPHTMIKKCAESEAIRKVFSDKLGILPYTEYEDWTKGGSQTLTIEKVKEENEVKEKEEKKPILELGKLGE